MNPITSSHLRTNNPPTVSNGYTNWWDVASLNTQKLPIVQAPFYGHPSQTSINRLTPLQNGFTTPMSLITSLNKGCGCQGAK